MKILLQTKLWWHLAAVKEGLENVFYFTFFFFLLEEYFIAV